MEDNLQIFKMEMKKESGWKYPVDKKCLAYAAGLLWNDFEKRYHRNIKKWSSLYGKTKINNWNRMNEQLLELFQKCNHNIDMKNDEDALIRGIYLYFLVNYKLYENDIWVTEDDINFTLGFLK